MRMELSNNQSVPEEPINMGDRGKKTPEFQPCYFENAHEEYDYPVGLRGKLLGIERRRQEE